MSDAGLRKLEHAWRSSGSDEAERAYLQARLRSGRLERGALHVAAYLGDEVAKSFLGADGVLATQASLTGVARFLEHLPGDGPTRARAGLAALRHLREQQGDAQLTVEALACLEAFSAWLEAGPPAEAELGAVEVALATQEAGFSADGRFNPEYPVIAYTYEVEPERALELTCWILARFASGRDPEPWSEVGRCLGEATSGDKAVQRALRDAVRAALLPWVLFRDPAAGAEPPAGVEESLLGTGPMTPQAAAAVRAAAPPEPGRPTTDQARAVVEAFFLAQGYRLSRGSLVNETNTRRVKLMKRGLSLMESKPGAWTKAAASKGREIRLTDTALHLLELARRFTP